MKTIRTLVVDDEPLAGKLIASYVEKTPFLELTGLCLDGIHALQLISEGKADLVFCDIQMPDITGMELSKMASSPQVKFIFTTAYAQYAIEGYKVSALDGTGGGWRQHDIQDPLAEGPSALFRL